MFTDPGSTRWEERGVATVAAMIVKRLRITNVEGKVCCYGYAFNGIESDLEELEVVEGLSWDSTDGSESLCMVRGGNSRQCNTQAYCTTESWLPFIL